MKRQNKFIALLLVLIMCISFLPATVAQAEGVEHEFVIGLNAFNKANMVEGSAYTTTPVLRPTYKIFYFRNAMNWKYEIPAEYSATGEAFMAMNLSATDAWALEGVHVAIGNPPLYDGNLTLEFKPSTYTTTTPSYIAFRLNVEAAGTYRLQANVAKNTNAPVPAVYFFKDGTEGVTNTSVATYPTAAKLGYYDIPTNGGAYADLGVVTVAKGEYIVSFVGDATSAEKNATVAANGAQNFAISGIKLVPSVADEVESIELSASQTTLFVGGATAALSVTADWTVSGEKEVEIADVEFAVEGDAVTVANGVVTPVAEGTATITATYKGKTDVVEFTVSAPATGAVEHEFVIGLKAFNKENMIESSSYGNTPTLRPALKLLYFRDAMNWKYEIPAEYSATGEAFMAMDLTKTDGWAIEGVMVAIGNPPLYDGNLTLECNPNNYGTSNPSYIAFRLNVKAAGTYQLQVDANKVDNAPVPAVYFFKDGTQGVTNTSVGTYPTASKLGYYDVPNSNGYTNIGTVTVPEAGEYIVSFVCDATSKTANTTVAAANGAQNFAIKSMKLVPTAADELESIELSASQTTLFVGVSIAELSAKANWTVTGKRDLTASELDFAVEPAGIVEVSADGVVTPLAEGTATVTATLKSDNTKSTSVQFTVTPAPVQSTKEYIFGLDVFNKDKMIEGSAYTTTPVLRPSLKLLYFKPAMSWKYEIPAEYSGTDPQAAFMAMDLTKTAPWELVDYKTSIGSAILFGNVFALEFKPDNYGSASPSYAAFRLRIDAPGEYILQVNASKQADAPVPAVYFFKDGTEGVTNTAPSTYLASSKLSYLDIPKVGGQYVSVGKINATVSGDYIIAFVGDATSSEKNATVAGNGAQNFRLQSIKIIPASEDTPTNELKLSSKNQLVMVGREMQLELSRIYALSGEVAVTDFSEYKFESSDNEVATVSDSGLVTGVAASENPITITVTLKADPTVKGTILMKVVPESEQETYEYKTVSSAFNYDQLKGAAGINSTTTDDYYYRDLVAEYGFPQGAGAAMIMNERLADPELIIPVGYYSDGTPAEPFYAMDTTDLDGDAKGTDPWKFVGGRAIDIATTTLFQIRGDNPVENHDGFHPYFDRAEYTDGADTHFAAFSLTVPAKGEYMLSLDARHHDFSPAPAVYFFKDTEGWYDDASFIETADKLGYFKANDVSKSGYEYIANVNIPEAGNYVVALVMDTNSAAISPNGMGAHGAQGSQYISLFGIKLVPSHEDKCTGISISAETDLMYSNEELQLTVNEVWEIVGEKEVLDVSSIIFESSDDEIATVDENGVVTGVGKGQVTIKAIKKNTYPEVSDTFDITVYEQNESILGVRLNYVMASAVMKDQTRYDPHNNRLDATGNLRDLSYVDDYSEIDGTKTNLWAFNNSAELAWRVLQSAHLALATTPRGYQYKPFFAFKIRVPIRGEYYLNASIASLDYGSEADFHVLPVGELASVNTTHATDDNYVGTLDATGEPEQRLGLVSFANPGDYYVIIKLHSDNENLDGEGRHMLQLKGISLVAPAGPFTLIGMYINGEDAEGVELPYGASRELTYAICDAAGVQHEDVDYENDVTVNSLEVTKGKGDIADIVKKNGKYYIETYEKFGEVNITANMTYDGTTVETVISFTVADIAKTGRTIYTDEMISNARENIKKYSWAREQRDTAVQNADRFVSLGADYLWNMISGNGLPRAYNVALEKSHEVRDPNEFFCRYCNANLLDEYGNYPWKVDGINDPWKIKCPKCSRRFPSNEFGKFYELGRTQENGGLFDRDTALENHRRMLIEKGLMSEEAIAMEGPGEAYSEDWYKYYGYGVKGGYLFNDLYYNAVGTTSGPVRYTPETGETPERWGVDDGYGYVTGRTYDNGVEEVHPYIAYFNHFGVYYGDLAQNALKNLGLAYLYTGEEKYGRLGAIILDRIADIYPDMSIKYWSSAFGRRYPNSTGGSPSGKDVGRIWGCFTAKNYADSYDIFYPMFEDEKVIEFLSDKAAYYEMENDKSTPTKIRQNIEDGVCREIFEACKTSQINGNFGLHHAALIDAAVALDNRRDTSEMIEWLYAASVTDGHSSNTGGDVNRKLLETVYRDGMVNESPYYNDMTFSQLVSPAVTLETYIANGGELDCVTLFEHPKFLKTFTSFMPITMLRRGIRTLADTGDPLDFPQYPGSGSLITAFNATKNREDKDIQEEVVKIAQLLYMYKGEELREAHYDIWTKNPEAVYAEVKAVVDEHGEYNWDKSTIMTGYGYATLRDGTLYDIDGVSSIRDTERSFMLNFSGHNLHNHTDMLDLQIDSYGIPFTYDFGYAEFMVTGDPFSRLTATTIGHNTVVVDETSQSGSKLKNGSGIPQNPLHFDALDTRVKVMDARTPVAYEMCDDYRRTVVMVNFDDEVSYGVDFFRVDGGSDHLYTFSPSSNTRPQYSDNLTFIKQVDEPLDTWIDDHRNYYPYSSYAGPSVQFGEDPGGYGNYKYPAGYTWMYDVERADNPGTGEFYLDWAIKDFRKQSRNTGLDLRLRMTMLNEFTVDEVSLVSVIPQRIKANEEIDHFEKVLIRRKGENLDSLFTTVYEPYKDGNRYVTDIQQVDIARTGGEAEGADDVAKAVKVVLGENRTDYIVYATNRDVIYTVTDGDYSFEFAGFVGVWTVNANGECTYKYLSDGTLLGEGENKLETAEAAVTGKIVDFQKEFSLDNWIDVEFDRDMGDIEVAELVDRMIVPERDTEGTSAYLIEGIEKTGDRTARINLNSTSTIDGYVDMFDESKGYIYVLTGGENFEIPMSYEDNGAPVFDAVEDKRVSAGSSIKITVNATPITEDLTVSYAARTLPRGASFDAETATFSWKPTSAQTGTNLVALDAIDSEGRVSTIYFEVEVLGSTSGGGGGGGIDLPPKDDEPTTDEPGTDEPTGDEPGTDEPGTDEPGTDVPTGDKKGFTDLGNHAWAEDSINALADEGIIKGTSEETFSPAANITRADYAILLVRAFELESDSTGNFADVESSDYFAEELAVARNTGIVNGIGDNNYAPRKTITRQDMMVILYRALTKLGIELKPVEGLSVESYPDYANVADYAQEAVKALVEAGLVNGKSGRLAGDETTTRAEVAVLLKRIIDYIAK